MNGFLASALIALCVFLIGLFLVHFMPEDKPRGRKPPADPAAQPEAPAEPR